MPPSPSLRCSPSPKREVRGENHKRGHSLGSGMVREKDDDLALFNEMQTKESENFLLQENYEFEDPFSSKLRQFSDMKLGVTVPARGPSNDLLNGDGEKNDYDWLLTPPDTPLFPSLDDEAVPANLASRGRPRSQPVSISRSSTMEKSYKSSRGSASPQRSSPSPRSSSSGFPSRGRPSSAPQSSPTSTLRSMTPTRRPSPPPGKSVKPAPRSSSPTPRRLSTGSSCVASSALRGTSPVKSIYGNSASPKVRAWQSNIPGFSSDAPPNLRTSLVDRPASYVRGSSPASRNSLADRPRSYVRGSSPASRNNKDSSSAFSRQSISPTASRSISASYSHDRDQFSSHSKGSVASSGDDDMDSVQSTPIACSDGLPSRRSGAFAKNKASAFSRPSRTLSTSSAPKRSFDSALRQPDYRKRPQNMFRPLLSSVPSTTFHVGNATSSHWAIISRNSSVTTSSNASSDQGTSLAPETEESDYNHDDVTSQYGSILPNDVQEEVFVFDKVDAVYEDMEQENFDESLSTEHANDQGEARVQYAPKSSEDACHHGSLVAATAASEALQVKAYFLEAVNSEDVTCSKCCNRFRPIELVEEDSKLCPDCSMKCEHENMTSPGSREVYIDSNILPMNVTEKGKSLCDFSCDGYFSGPSEVTKTEESVEQGQAPYLDESENCVQKPSLVRAVPEEYEVKLVDQREMNTSNADFSLPPGDVVDQPVEQLKNHRDKLDASSGAGISVLLLNRSSSIKGNVVQGRALTATAIPYDDLSYARDGANSLRLFSSHGSVSASSSVDLSSSRQTEAYVQRQLSGRKYDMENYKNIMNTRPQSIDSSVSGTSSLAYPSLGHTKSCEDNSDISVSNVEHDSEIISISYKEQVPASEFTDADVASQTLMRISGSQEGNYECNENCQMKSSFTTSEVSSHELLDNLEEITLASCPTHEDSTLFDNSKDNSKFLKGVLDAEEPAMTPDSSFVQCSDANLEGSKASEIPSDSSLVTSSEIKIEGDDQTKDGPQLDVVSKKSNNDMDRSEDPSEPSSSDNDVAGSLPDPSSSHSGHGILDESTVVVEEGQGGNKGRSLTLEEATEAILFCSSIVHNLAYQAATMAIEKENSTPVEGSRPTVTILGKPSSDRKEPRGRAGGRRSLRSQKPRQKRAETDKKVSNSITENDENAGELVSQNIGLPDKVDSMKPPKLESKCNCTIM